MFSDKDRTFLKDIIQHSQYARSYVEGMRQSDFMTDTKTVHAVERCINIIGEAAIKLSDDAIIASPDIPWQEIRGMRNRIVHDYGMVNLDIVTEHANLRDDWFQAALVEDPWTKPPALVPEHWPEQQ